MYLAGAAREYSLQIRAFLWSFKRDLRKVTVGLTALFSRRVRIILKDCDLDVGLKLPRGAVPSVVCLFDK